MTCKQCKGDGIIVVPQLTKTVVRGGVQEVIETCPTCQGTGEQPKKEKR